MEKRRTKYYIINDEDSEKELVQSKKEGIRSIRSKRRLAEDFDSFDKRYALIRQRIAIIPPERVPYIKKTVVINPEDYPYGVKWLRRRWRKQKKQLERMGENPRTNGAKMKVDPKNGSEIHIEDYPQQES